MIRAAVFLVWLATVTGGLLGSGLLSNGSTSGWLGQRIAAQEITLGTAPSNPARAGFSMSIVSDPLGAQGRQPLRLTFMPTRGAFTRQRELRIQLRPRCQYTTELDYQFTKEVTIPQGATRFTKTIYVPQFYRWEQCSVRILEGGSPLSRVTSRMTLSPAVQDWGQHVSVGIIEPSVSKPGEAGEVFPDMRSMVTVLGDGPIDSRTEIKRLKDQKARDFAIGLTHSWIRFRPLEEQSLEDSWLAYTQLDLILAPISVIQRLEEKSPEVTEAIQKWIAAGGELWIYGAPKAEQAKVAWMAKLPKDPVGQFASGFNARRELSLDEQNAVSRIEFQPWNYGQYFSSSYSYGTSSMSRKSVYDSLRQAKNPMSVIEKRSAIMSTLDLSRYGLGRIVMLHDSDPFPGSFQLWSGLKRDRLKWDNRYGISYESGSNSYWAWLMAAVGRPPVTMFVILNGLFVLVMGPVLYFVLRRRSKLYLLYFLAPALALLTTMGLFAYAFVLDGFDNRTKIRQLTWYDGRVTSPSGAGDQKQYPRIDQSRQTYYTVVDNQQGLTFENDWLVLPIPFSQLIDSYSYHTPDDRRAGDYRIDSGVNQTRYSGEFLPVRNQVHYLVTHPTFEAMPISIAFDDAGVPEVTNQMSSPIRSIGYHDKNRKYWSAEQIDAGQTITMKPDRANTLQGVYEAATSAKTSQIPKPYQSRFSVSDISEMEDRFRKLSRKPGLNTFILTTEIEESQVALRLCVREECERMIGGELP